jgi:hypothetical protein
MRFGIGALKLAIVLATAGMGMTFVPDDADAKQRYCRQEYCAKKAPKTVGCSGLWCVPRVHGGQCLQTGVRLVKC